MPSLVRAEHNLQNLPEHVTIEDVYINLDNAVAIDKIGGPEGTLWRVHWIGNPQPDFFKDIDFGRYKPAR